MRAWGLTYVMALATSSHDGRRALRARAMGVSGNASGSIHTPFHA
jgi:hypothetical protein